MCRRMPGYTKVSNDNRTRTGEMMRNEKEVRRVHHAYLNIHSNLENDMKHGHLKSKKYLHELRTNLLVS